MITPDVHNHSKNFTDLAVTALHGYEPPTKEKQHNQHQQHEESGGSKESSSNSFTKASSSETSSSSNGSSSSLPQPQQQQQQQQQPQQQQQQEAVRHVAGPAYDAIITLGGQLLNKQLLGSLKVAQRKAGKMLPPLIACSVSDWGYWGPGAARGGAKFLGGARGERGGGGVVQGKEGEEGEWEGE